MSVDKIPVKQRRFDSLAWLLQGDNTCAASCFHDGKLLMSFNFCPQRTNLPSLTFHEELGTNFKNGCSIFTLIKSHLTLVARSSREFVESVHSENSKNRFVAVGEIIKSDQDEGEILTFSMDIIRRYNAHKKECQESLEQLASSAGSLSSFAKNNKTYREAFLRSLVKVTRSVRHSYISPNTAKAMDKDVVSAINTGNIELITPQVKDYPNKDINPTREIHAEMILLNHLIEKGGLQAEEKIYIGVSKQCCLACEIAIMAVNDVRIASVTEEKEDGHDKISYRDGHRYIFPSVPPPFLLKSEALKNKFVELFRIKILELSKQNSFKLGHKMLPKDFDFNSLTFEQMFLLKEAKHVGPEEQIHDNSVSRDSFSASYGPFKKTHSK